MGEKGGGVKRKHIERGGGNGGGEAEVEAVREKVLKVGEEEEKENSNACPSQDAMQAKWVVSCSTSIRPPLSTVF